MRTVTFKSVLDGVARALGMDPARDLTSARAATLTGYINKRVREGHKFEFWPEWTLVEARYYRDLYSATADVAAGDERFFILAGKYYQALRAQSPAVQAPATVNSGGAQENSAWWAESCGTYTTTPWTAGGVYGVGDKVLNGDDGLPYQCHTAHVAGAGFDATKFGVLTPFRKYIAYAQVEEGVALTVIEEVKTVWRTDPRLYQRGLPRQVGFEPGPEGIRVEGRAPAVVWVEFRSSAPEFTSTAWSVTAAYVAGNRVYYASTGECYVAVADNTGTVPGSDPTVWARIEMPAVLASFVERAAMADGLKDQKQTDRALEEIQEALEELQEASDRALAAQGQFATAGVAAYGSG